MVPEKKDRLKKISYGFHLTLRFWCIPSPVVFRIIIGNCIQLTRVKPHQFPPRRLFAAGFGLAPLEPFWVCCFELGFKLFRGSSPILGLAAPQPSNRGSIPSSSISGIHRIVDHERLSVVNNGLMGVVVRHGKAAR